MAYIPTNKSEFDSRLAPLLPDYSHAPPDARIIELLRTNAPPTDFERTRLKATLSETPDHITELDSLIRATTSLLDYLTKDRNQALENQAIAKKILTPCCRLPPEMLTEIFLWCRALRGPRDPLLHLRAVPWTLTHVCREWRKVAIATPEIWTTIRLNFRHDMFLNGNHVHKAVFMLGLMLDRARPYDLSVIIEYEDDISTHPACAILLSSVRYWKSLVVRGTPRYFAFLSPCRGLFDRLATVEVWEHYRRRVEPIDIFSVAPRLRSFTTTLDAPFLLPANLVEFINLESFTEKTYTTLRELVNIEDLTLSCGSYSSELPRIYLPRVSQLQLRTSEQNVGTAFVTYDHFDLPSLAHLHIVFISKGQMLPSQVVQPIRSSTVTNLTLTWSLFISQKPFTMDIVLDLFPYCRLPNLQHLTVKGCSHINPFLRALSILPGKNVIFPKMSALDIQCSHFFGFEDLLDMHILVELVQSRIDQGALREFDVWWKKGLFNDDADTRSRWQQLSALGGGIQISASIKGL
ncbi:hypothetical protein F5146DRAFT_1072458 [Armillaria mellea]|nr:hypothetical protein F5146DRAFT_1072458 [Armillaria mellea]